jgi:hypothetical protein
MKVTNIPSPASPALYAEAIDTYVRLVKRRAVAVYSVGNVQYPGLSDIDLVVVPNGSAVDNQYFFSAKGRLPRRFVDLFLHEPFILPRSCLQVMRHTTHHAPVLLAGQDVVRPFLPREVPAERWCRMLESYCSYSGFARRVRQSQSLHGRWTMAVANAFRYLLADAALAFPEVADHGAYVRHINAIRSQFFDLSDPSSGVHAAWELFAEHFDRLDTMLREWLGGAEPHEAVQKSRALLSGEMRCSDFDAEYAIERARTIERYYQALQSAGFPYGGLFLIAAHPRGRRSIRKTPVTALLHTLYRVRRRLSEYTGA